MRLKAYKMAMSILPKFLTLKWNVPRTLWRIEVGDGFFFFSFFMLFHLSLTLFRPDVPFKVSNGFLNVMYQSIPSLAIPRAKPPGNFFGGRIPHPRAKKSSKPPPPRAYKNELKPDPRGYFPQLFTIKT